VYSSYVNVRRPGAPTGLLAVLHAAHAAEAEVEAKLNEVRLSMAKLMALKAISEAGESLPLGQLAGRLSCVKSNITQLVDRLEVEGLVKRGSCPDDRRAVRAMVTPEGRERHEAGVAAIRSVQEELAGKLDASDRKRLVRLLSELVG
jgi:DNA-binding MarR family transcriptional regulator